MPITPSPLKWLAEKRARAAGALLKAEYQAGELASLAEAAAAAAAKANRAISRAEALRVDVASLDRALGFHTSSLSGADIESVHGWAGRYGKRGALREQLLKHLERCYPRWVTTGVLSDDA